MKYNSSVYSSEEGTYMVLTEQEAVADKKQHPTPVLLETKEIEQAIVDGKQPFIFYPTAEDATFVYIVFPPREISDQDVIEAVNTSAGLSFKVNRSEICQHYCISTTELRRVETIIKKATKRAGEPMNHGRYAFPVRS